MLICLKQMSNFIKGVVNLAGKILGYLDITSLGRAERVSKIWRKTLLEANVWQALLDKEVLFKSVYIAVSERCSC